MKHETTKKPHPLIPPLPKRGGVEEIMKKIVLCFICPVRG